MADKEKIETWAKQEGVPFSVVHVLKMNNMNTKGDMRMMSREEMKSYDFKESEEEKLCKALIKLGNFTDETQVPDPEPDPVPDPVPVNAAYHRPPPPSQEQTYKPSTTNQTASLSLTAVDKKPDLERVKSNSVLVADKPVMQYRVHLHSVGEGDKKLNIQRVEFGDHKDHVPIKSLLMVGETGSGKSTMIDAMLNFVLGVEPEHKTRFFVIDPRTAQAKKQSESQTDWVTCYTINHVDSSPVPYTLNIIDTPGFGDTRGVQQDKLIVEQIRNILSGKGEYAVDELNAICFVIKAATNRLTASQRYVYDSITALFGKNLAQNIYIFCSYSDSTDENVNVKSALESAEVPFKEMLNFNNCWIKVAVNKASQFFWEMTDGSFTKFFKTLNDVEPKSLSLTVEVMKMRAQLETTVAGLLELLMSLTSKLVNLDDIEQNLRKSESTFNVPVTEHEKVNTAQVNMNCPKCMTTCKINCPEMTKEALRPEVQQMECRVCRCQIIEHNIAMWKFEVALINKRRVSIIDLQKKYRGTSVIEGVGNDKKKIIRDIENASHKMKNIIATLNKIALRPQTAGGEDYMDMAIDVEEKNHKPGYRERIEMMKKLKKQTKLIERVAGQDFDMKALLSEYI